MNTIIVNKNYEDKWNFNPKNLKIPYLNKVDMNLEIKTLALKGVEPVVTLISNYVFALIVSFLINLENNQYDEDYKNSFISKTVPFDVFAALFTPVVNSFKMEKQDSLWSSTMVSLFFTVVTYSLNVKILLFS